MALLTAQQTALEVIVNMCCSEGLLPPYIGRFPAPTPAHTTSGLSGSLFDTPVTPGLPSPQIPRMMNGKSSLVATKVKPLWKAPSVSAAGS